MFTQIKNGKRKCVLPVSRIHSWRYLQGVLEDSGFSIEQDASPKEYIMKGCRGQILVYVKFNTDTQCKVLFISESDLHKSLDLDWGDGSEHLQNGDLVLNVIRQLWYSLTRLSE